MLPCFPNGVVYTAAYGEVPSPLALQAEEGGRQVHARAASLGLVSGGLQGVRDGAGGGACPAVCLWSLLYSLGVQHAVNDANLRRGNPLLSTHFGGVPT